MLFTPFTLTSLAHHLTLERKRQGLSRTQAAAVCNVSPSFIRDAEGEPARCSMGRLLQYMAGLGLALDVVGWSNLDHASSDRTEGEAAAVPVAGDDESPP